MFPLPAQTELNALASDPVNTPAILGAQCDLTQRVKMHLFVISPNNSGSTFVTRALETCQEVWRLPREGQHMLGYSGPDLLKEKRELIWASDQANLDSLRDPTLYDWAKTQKAWYFQARASKDDASIFLTKSPPFLVVVDQLRAAFSNPRFLFLVRNPYAVVEAICRRVAGRFEARNAALDTACGHILNCLAIQRLNIEQHGDLGVSFSYEDLCASPAGIASQVTHMLPELVGLNFDQTLAVKGIYNERLRDMNADQIGRLSQQDIDRINLHFSPQEALLGHFGYGLIG